MRFHWDVINTTLINTTWCLILSFISSYYSLFALWHMTPNQTRLEDISAYKECFLKFSFRHEIVHCLSEVHSVGSQTKQKKLSLKWPASSEFGTYHICEQRRFRRACASAQSRQNLRCSLIQAVSQEEPSDRKPDRWLLWMAGHAQLKFVMTKCSKTQIRLTGLKWCLLLNPLNLKFSYLSSATIDLKFYKSHWNKNDL